VAARSAVLIIADEAEYPHLCSHSNVAVVGGGITAAVAIFRDRERGALVLIPLVVALALAWLLIGEIVAPH